MGQTHTHTHRVTGQDLLVLVLNGRREGSSAWVTGQSTQLFRNETHVNGEAHMENECPRQESNLRTSDPKGRTDEKTRQAKHRNTVSVAGSPEKDRAAGCDTSRGSQSRAAIQRPMMRVRPEQAKASRGERAPARETPHPREGGDGDVVRLVANKSPGQRLSLNRSQ